MPKTKNPTVRAARQGFLDVDLQADNQNPSKALHSPQAQFAARWLARRAPVSLAMASTIVEIHGLGGAHGR